MSSKNLIVKSPRLWRLGATIVLLAAAGWILASNNQALGRGMRALTGADWRWLAAGLGCTVVTFCIAAGIYRLLALTTVRYRQLLLVELAAAFANRLLPAGLGGLSLHGVYLYRRGHTPAQATAVVSVNNLLGITAHLLLLALIICFQPHLLGRFTAHLGNLHWWYIVAVASIIAVAALPPVRTKLRRFAANLARSFRRLRPQHVLAAFVSALLLTTTYTLVLYSSAHALGMHLSLLQVFIVFSLGMLVGTATPTPGGLVGVEAGLFAGFTAYGTPTASATAAVIIYRLLTYWLPLVPGVSALLIARHKHLV